jgi:hypothetical protein
MKYLFNYIAFYGISRRGHYFVICGEYLLCVVHKNVAALNNSDVLRFHIFLVLYSGE